RRTARLGRAVSERSWIPCKLAGNRRWLPAAYAQLPVSPVECQQRQPAVRHGHATDRHAAGRGAAPRQPCQRWRRVVLLPHSVERAITSFFFSMMVVTQIDACIPPCYNSVKIRNRVVEENMSSWL